MRSVVERAPCAGCRRTIDEGGYHVVVPRLAGSFHSFACAEAAYRRELDGGRFAGVSAADAAADVASSRAQLEQPAGA